MSDKIGNRPPGPSVGNTPATQPARPQRMTTEGSDNSQNAHDRFERGGAQGAGLRGQQPVAGPDAQKVQFNRAQFNDVALARMAEQFAVYLAGHPKASKDRLAKEFVRGALKRHPKLAKMLQEMGEQAAESMFDALGDALAGSPVMSQTLDEVRDEAQKMIKRKG